MKTFSTRNNLPNFIRSIIILIFWIGIWWISAVIVDRKVLLPSPPDVFSVLCDLLITLEFWGAVSASLLRVFLGYFVGCISGAILAALCFYSRTAEALFSPALSVIRTVPVASFIILALVWIGRQSVPVFIAFLMVLPIIMGNVRAGFTCADHDLYEVTQLYNFGFVKRFFYLYLPSVIPHFLSGARTSLGLAWKAGIAAEVLCSLSFSIGGKIYESKLYLETETLFAWTLTVIVISVVMEKLLFLLPQVVSRNRKETHTA